jgi:hypothetical protein
MTKAAIAAILQIEADAPIRLPSRMGAFSDRIVWFWLGLK